MPHPTAYETTVKTIEKRSNHFNRSINQLRVHFTGFAFGNLSTQTSRRKGDVIDFGTRLHSVSVSIASQYDELAANRMIDWKLVEHSKKGETLLR